MALCTQNRCADQTALHLVSPSEAYRSTRSMKTRTELAHPFCHKAPQSRGGTAFFRKSASSKIGRKKKPYSAGALTFFGFLFDLLEFPNPARSRLRFGPFACLEVDSNHWHKDFQSFALTSWATWTTFLNSSSSNSALAFFLLKKGLFPFLFLSFSLVRQAFEQLFQLPPNLPKCSKTESRPGTAGGSLLIERR